MNNLITGKNNVLFYCYVVQSLRVTLVDKAEESQKKKKH